MIIMIIRMLQCPHPAFLRLSVCDECTSEQQVNKQQPTWMAPIYPITHPHCGFHSKHNSNLCLWPPQRNQLKQNFVAANKNSPTDCTNEKTPSFPRFSSLPDQPGFKGLPQVRSWRSAEAKVKYSDGNCENFWDGEANVKHSGLMKTTRVLDLDSAIYSVGEW